MEAAIDEKKTVGILVEPIQAEGGVIVAERDLYARFARTLRSTRRVADLR